MLVRFAPASIVLASTAAVPFASRPVAPGPVAAGPVAAGPVAAGSIGSAWAFRRRERLRGRSTGGGASARGGGAVGTGIGPVAAIDWRRLGPSAAAAPVALAARVRGVRPSRTDLRLAGPRTGVRRTNTHPTSGTGLPPMRRPSSKSQS